MTSAMTFFSKQNSIAVLGVHTFRADIIPTVSSPGDNEVDVKYHLPGCMCSEREQEKQGRAHVASTPRSNELPVSAVPTRQCINSKEAASGPVKLRHQFIQ